MGYGKITRDVAKRIINSDTDSVLVDVGTKKEFDENHMEGAISFPNESIDVVTADCLLPDKNKLTLVYSKGDGKSRDASKKLVQMGYSNIKEFDIENDWGNNDFTE